MFRGLSSRDLVSLTGCSLFAILLKVYIDDSADEKHEKVVVAGAFLGTFKQFCDLKNSWNRRLKLDGLKYFRSTEYYSLRGEFSRYRDPVRYPKPKGSEAARALRDDLDAIIRNSCVIGIAVAIPIVVYEEVRRTEPLAEKLFKKDPFEAALQSLIEVCVETSRQHFRSTKLAFICDNGPSAPRIAKAYTRFCQINPEIGEIAQALVHLDDKHFPQLQAADLVAHLSREFFMQHQANPTAATLKRLQQSVSEIRAWDRAFMLRAIQNNLHRLTHATLALRGNRGS